MLELDLLIGKFAKNNFQKLTEKDCEIYEKEILSMETVDLYNLTLGDKRDQKTDKIFINKIRQEMMNKNTS